MIDAQGTERAIIDFIQDLYTNNTHIELTTSYTVVGATRSNNVYDTLHEFHTYMPSTERNPRNGILLAGD